MYFLRTKYLFLSTIHTWKSNPHCDGIWRWGFWEVIRSWRCALIRNNAILRRSQRAGSLSFCHAARGRNEKPAVCNLEEGSHQNLPMQAPWASRPVRNKFPFINYPLCGTLLKQSELIKQYLILAKVCKSNNNNSHFKQLSSWICPSC